VLVRTDRYLSCLNTDISQDRTLKCKISEPFNFQHLTHTASTHAKILRNASDGDLLSEFAAVRASQAPTEQLRGITAEDLAGWSACTSPRGDGTSEAMTALQPMKPECMDDNVNASKARIREAKSFPSLHRNSRSFSSLTPPVPVMMPPPRKSSRTSILLPVAPRTGNETMQGSPTRPDFFRHITRNASPPPPGTACSTWGFEALSAVMANSSEKPELALGSDDYVPDSNATALADVPEEDDVETMRPSVPSQRSGRSIALAPGTPVRDRGTSTSFSTIDEDELASRRDSDPVLPLQGSEPEDIPKGSSRHLSSTHPILAESWEDDVDYCYDHLLDAYSSSLGKNDLADPSPISTFTRSPGSEIDEITYQEQPSTVPSRVFLDLYERTPTTSPAVLTARARSQASLAAPDDCEYRFSHPQTLTRAFNDKAHEPLGLAILTCPPLMIPTRTTSTMPAPNTTTLPSTRYSPAYPSSADSSPESSYRASGGASSNEDDSYATSTGSTTSIPDLVASKTSTRQTSQEPLSPVTAEQSPISPFDRPPHMIGAGKGLPEKAPPTQPLEDWEMEALSRIRSLSDTPEVNEGWATKRRRAASTVTSGGARSSRAIFAPLDAIGALRC